MPTATPSPRPTFWKALAAGAVLFLGLDLAVFRSWLYGHVAKPESSLGWVARRTLLEPAAHPVPTQPSVLLVGDSTMAEGCSAERLQALLGGPPTAVVDASVPATPMRVWPFLFETLPAPPGGFTVAVLGLQTYDDRGEAQAMGERAQDLAFLGPLVRPAEVSAIAAEFPQENARRDLWLAALCRTYAWRLDLQDLCADPLQRYRDVRHQFGRLTWGQPYEGHDGSLAGLHVEGDHLVGLPPGDPQLEAQLRLVVWPPPGVDNSAHRRTWLGRFVERAAAAGTETVLVRMPMQVLPRAVPHAPDTRVVDELRTRPHVHVLAADLFAALERPEFFFDGLHLNRAGRERFTTLLATALRAEFPDRWGK